MAKKITETELQQVKAIPVEQIAAARGLELKQQGKELIAHCPFHDDKTPSFVITPSKNLWHCLGQCNKGGDVIQLVMQYDQVNFTEAVEFLQQLLPSLAAPKNGTTSHKAEAVDITEFKYQRILKQSFDYFQRSLKQNTQALAYLSRRGLAHHELLSEFGIGYADNSLASKLPGGKEGRQIREQLKQVGLLTDAGRVLFNGCLVFPIFDDKQRITEIYGRRVQERKGYPNHLYLPGPHKGIFNIKALASPEIILCESIIDAVSFWIHGCRNVTCSFGTNGFTAEMQEMFKGKTGKVFVAYDRDDAGENAATELASSLAALGISSYRVELPDGLDVNEYIGRIKEPESNLRLLLQSARPMEVVKANIEPPLNIRSQPTDELPRHRKGDGYIYTLGDRIYSFTGVEKNHSSDLLKVKAKIASGNKHYRDNGIDLYSNKAVKGLVRGAAAKLELEEAVIEKDLDRIIVNLEELQLEMIEESINANTSQEVHLIEAEIKAAQDYLKDPELATRIRQDFHNAGLVGEDVNLLVGYLAASSRKEQRPLAVIIQSESGAGKSKLMDAILDFIPEEDVVKYSAMTGQSLYYMGEKNLKNKILAIVEEEGAEKASYSLKLLQSEGKISIASTGKDVETGRLNTHEYKVEGPVMIFVSTTNIDIDEELRNRCIVLTVDQSREQTRRIQVIQRRMETLEGLFIDSNKGNIIKLQQNMQRLLRPIRIYNPYANDLTFIDKDHRTRRDQMKYLTLIRTIAFLHQYQREILTAKDANNQLVEYIKVTLGDIELANELANQVLGISLDELPPQTRRLLQLTHKFVQEECKKRKIDQEDFRFSRRELRSHLGISNNRLGIHLARLEDYEYLIKHHARRGQSFVYELIYNGEGQDGETFMLGLIDVAKLQKKHARVK